MPEKCQGSNAGLTGGKSSWPITTLGTVTTVEGRAMQPQNQMTEVRLVASRIRRSDRLCATWASCCCEWALRWTRGHHSATALGAMWLVSSQPPLYRGAFSTRRAFPLGSRFNLQVRESRLPSFVQPESRLPPHDSFNCRRVLNTQKQRASFSMPSVLGKRTRQALRDHGTSNSEPPA